ncbi:MAG: zf-HC2 domain-containing protein [Bryobacteraceae bacterium]|jgi:anti-sigma factor RsiW
MKCPIETRENAELLLAYCTRELDAESTAILERHMEICPACREFSSGQRAIWEALDAWEAAPVTLDFDRRLYRRIDREVSWWQLLMRPLRPALVRQGLSIAAAACLVVMAGVLLQHPASAPPAAQPRSAQVEAFEPDQVEPALDAMHMLGEFSYRVRGDAADPKM